MFFENFTKFWFQKITAVLEDWYHHIVFTQF